MLNRLPIITSVKQFLVFMILYIKVFLISWRDHVLLDVMSFNEWSSGLLLVTEFCISTFCCCWLVLKVNYVLFCSITYGQVNQLDGELTKSILENDKCYILDCGSEVFTWVGRHTQLEERKSTIQTAEVDHPCSCVV